LNLDAWSHHEPVRLRFGAGTLEHISEDAPAGGLLLVTSAGTTKRGLTARTRELLGGRIERVWDDVTPNPTIRSIESARGALGDAVFDGIIALGGGSVLDTAKTLSVLLARENRGVTLESHLVGKAPLAETRPLPMLAIPTTAGTGSEVTPFATVWDDVRKRKHSITTPHLHPRAAILDPELTLGLSEDVTRSSGLDALSHALESVWNRNATPFTLHHAVRAVSLILQNLPAAVRQGDAIEHRTRMLEASTLAGLAIARTRTAACHSISYPLTAHLGIPHGYACSFTLPAMLRYNAAEDDGRLEGICQAMGQVGVEGLARAIERLYKSVGAANIVRDLIPEREALTQFLDEMFTAERAGNNLRALDEDAVRWILNESAERILGI
jgi:alcohol dehydrogenase